MNRTLVETVHPDSEEELVALERFDKKDLRERLKLETIAKLIANKYDSPGDKRVSVKHYTQAGYISLEVNPESSYYYGGKELGDEGAKGVNQRLAKMAEELSAKGLKTDVTNCEYVHRGPNVGYFITGSIKISQ